jgi:hypothetical protein
MTSQKTPFFIVTAMKTSNLTYVSDTFCIQQGDALLPLILNFALEYSITKAQQSRLEVGLEINAENFSICPVS